MKPWRSPTNGNKSLEGVCAYVGTTIMIVEVAISLKVSIATLALGDCFPLVCAIFILGPCRGFHICSCYALLCNLGQYPWMPVLSPSLLPFLPSFPSPLKMNWSQRFPRICSCFLTLSVFPHFPLLTHIIMNILMVTFPLYVHLYTYFLHFGGCEIQCWTRKFTY